MGQARRRMEIRVNAAEIAKRRTEFMRSVPLRAVKGVVGFVAFIPLTMFAFAFESFKQNKWPWQLG